MKICPNCNQTYTDESLNFCLNDGATLVEKDSEPPPTVFMDAPRTTNPNFTDYEAPFGKTDQQIYQVPYSPPMAMTSSVDQTLPIISLVLGVLAFVTVCCYGGVPLGLGAVITGYLGMKNADQNPQKYGGKGIAIGGLILGAIGLASGLIFIIIAIISSVAN
ncbi:MAG: DUF4190 domain-containing protein [Pyrinomonadaceae bacterium]